MKMVIPLERVLSSPQMIVSLELMGRWVDLYVRGFSAYTDARTFRVGWTGCGMTEDLNQESQASQTPTE